MSTFRKKIDKTKYMSFLVKDGKLLKKYNKSWNKANKVLEKGFHSDPMV